VTSMMTLPGPEVPVIDESRLLAEFGGAPEILAELRDLFLEHAPPLYEGIGQALDSGDLPAIVDMAHSLKGACATYGAARLTMVCKSLELTARAGDLAGARQWREPLDTEYQAVFAAIGGIDA
jgi:HPt (histidine-containing phosphotransfer) domain-containing protein